MKRSHVVSGLAVLALLGVVGACAQMPTPPEQPFTTDAGPITTAAPLPPGPPVPLNTSATEQHSGQAQIKCPALSVVGSFDPIVMHGHGVMGHQHQFFGNRVLSGLSDPSAATYRQLLAQPTTCSNSNDSAVYWTPTLIDRSTGAVIQVKQFTAYYSTFDRKVGGIAEAFPPDLRLVSAMTADVKFNNWTCGQFEERKHPPQTTLPNCTGVSGKPGHTLTAHITFPSCWDGVTPQHPDTQVGDTRDNAHWAYTLKSGTKRTCPPGFPHQVTELRETIQFAYTGNAGANLILSSDAQFGTTQGASLHGDFWNTWQQAGLEQMLDRCVRRSSGTIFPGEC